jgi:formate dehydrogenase subunit delta
MSSNKLVYMANQIGTFFATQHRVNVAEAVADHLRKFWDPRMRNEIKSYLQDGGAGFDPAIREAVQLLVMQDRPTH